MNNVICPYCNLKARKVSGDVIYPNRADLHSREYYLCKKCGARVGVNKVTGEPLGTLAGVDLRMHRMEAHKVFDRLWRSKKYTRSEAYNLLADTMGIDSDECHIGMFDHPQCDKVIEMTKLIQQKK
jgi:pyruvate formate-lyase activating enzyme-like uncharacterized protein